MASSSCCSASATQALCSQLKLHCRVSSSARHMIPNPTTLPFAATSCPLLSLSFSSKSHPPLNPRPPRCTSAPVLDNPTNVEAAGDSPKPEEAREQVFAVVMIGSRQYIVFPGRYIYTQRLKGATPNDKIVLNKVLLVGTKTSTYIGKPVVPNAVVHAVVQEQGLDPKVMVFKYKKKKKYRRNIGHRQPNTRIMITGITGYQDSPAVTLDSL